jgi:hypothetical protein
MWRTETRAAGSSTTAPAVVALSNRRPVAAEIPFILGFALLALPAFLLLFNALGFLLGLPVSDPASLFAVGATLLATWYLANARLGKRPLLILALMALGAALVLAAVFGVALAYDLSADGQFYHQEAIVQLARGWDPLYESPLPPDNASKLFVEHYAKGPWICSAAVYLATGRIETAKCFSVLLMVAAFCFGLHALLTFRLRWFPAVLLAMLAALNPVSTCQWLGFYIDGQLAALLTILVALAFLLVQTTDTWFAATTALALIVITNIKFTGGLYAAVLLCPLWLWLILRRRWDTQRGMTIALVVGSILGALFVGYSTYVTNTRDHGHPFYPLAGSSTMDIMTGATPSNLLESNRLVKLATAVFSESKNEHQPHGTRFKWPFSVSRDEITGFSIPDMRIGGFGPWFGGAMLLTGLLLAAAYRRDARAMAPLLAVLVIVVGSTLIHAHGWWARYAPQLWLVPTLVMAGTWRCRWPPCSWLRVVLLVVLFINAGMVSAYYVHSQIDGTLAERQVLIELGSGPQPIWVSFGVFRSIRVRLEEAGLAYRETCRPEDLPCATPIVLDGYTARICQSQPLHPPPYRQCYAPEM